MNTVKGFVKKNLKKIVIGAGAGALILVGLAIKNRNTETGLPEGYDGLETETETEVE